MAGKRDGAGRLLEDAQARLAARLLALTEAVEAEAIPADAAGRAEEAKRLGVMCRAGAALALMRQRNERARNERFAGAQRRKLAGRGATPHPSASPTPSPARGEGKNTKDTDERRARRIERLRRIADRQIESIERTIEIKCAEGRSARAARGVPALAEAELALGAAGA